MPERKRTRKFASDEVQGEGSWVTATTMTVAGQRKVLTALAAVKGKEGLEATLANFEVGVKVIKTHVKTWNWVDDDGKPFLQPKDDPEVLEHLTDQEVKFLSECIRGSEKDAKN